MAVLDSIVSRTLSSLFLEQNKKRVVSCRVVLCVCVCVCVSVCVCVCVCV